MTLTEVYKLYLEHPHVCTDTRKITEGCIFFALKGPNFNANTFAPAALAAGAAYAIIDEREYEAGERCIVVEDVLRLLQDLACHHRKQLKIPVIAIAGSNGKTTTKELVTTVLGQRLKVWATPGNFNNHIGLPLTLLQLNNTYEVAVIEMGANHIGENAFLCELAAPDLGLVTNNGKDHLEGFGSMEGVARSNSELYYYLEKNNGLTFVNANDEWLMRMASRLTRKVTYAANSEGRRTNADEVGEADSLRPQIVFTLQHTHEARPLPGTDTAEHTEVRSPLSGDYNFDNIMAAVALGRHFRLTDDEIRKGIEDYEPSNNRSQVLKKKANTIYLDAYNANPSSMEASLRNFAAMPFDGKVAIIGDMFELGPFAAEEHRNIIALCESIGLADVILIGEEFVRQNTSSYRGFAVTNEAVDYVKKQQFHGKNIFMKGSRGMKLEQIAEVIQ